MKKIFFALFIVTLLSGCGSKGLEQLSSCGECVQGLQSLANDRSLTPLIEAYKPNE